MNAPLNPTAPTAPPERPLLSAIEARVLGTLMEKARTVPDSYPLSLNNLVLGCNQKTSREPVMSLTEAQVQEALDALQQRHLVREVSGSRVARYEHNFQRGVGVPEQSAVLLGLLLLRGAQTAGELRINSERWYRFADISSVEAFLDELQQRPAAKGGALVVPLPRAAGEREQRWAHLLCGTVATLEEAIENAAPGGGGLPQRLATLEAEVALLRHAVQRLCDELGLENLAAPPG